MSHADWIHLRDLPLDQLDALVQFTIEDASFDHPLVLRERDFRSLESRHFPAPVMIQRPNCQDTAPLRPAEGKARGEKRIRLELGE